LKTGSQQFATGNLQPQLNLPDLFCIESKNPNIVQSSQIVLYTYRNFNKNDISMEPTDNKSDIIKS
jgi:hypothetical protein